MTQHLISICEIETAQSDICSISVILFYGKGKMFEEFKTALTSYLVFGLKQYIKHELNGHIS